MIERHRVFLVVAGISVAIGVKAKRMIERHRVFLVVLGISAAIGLAVAMVSTLRPSPYGDLAGKCLSFGHGIGIVCLPAGGPGPDWGVSYFAGLGAFLLITALLPSRVFKEK